MEYLLAIDAHEDQAGDSAEAEAALIPDKPVGRSHGWDGDVTLCGLRPPQVWVCSNHPWVRNQFACRECLIAEAHPRDSDVSE